MLFFETSDACFLVFTYAQPAILGFLLFIIVRPGLVSRVLFLQLKSSRRRLKSTRFFECAVYSRLVGQFKFDLMTLGLALAFLIYDVDLVFFLAETTVWQHWSLTQACCAAIYFLFFAVGLWYDHCRYGFLWSL